MFGALTKKNLPKGKYRHLTDKEVMQPKGWLAKEIVISEVSVLVSNSFHLLFLPAALEKLSNHHCLVHDKRESVQIPCKHFIWTFMEMTRSPLSNSSIYISQ